ncbi:MAG: membrane integrity-associated transporter subunit PqiC [Desulfamplus sp.]|nr:membrane integrity-associated transporter subunit PqiC [Desulfamplus sp.]MBF0413297.1 membrane integrity-associated transporter subunit PqiC [Desulfamplus sp.]
MRKTAILIIFVFTFMISILFMGGCITSKPSKFYLLTPASYNTGKNAVDAKNVIRDTKNLTVGLGPVSIAKYLDRSQLVVRLTPNQIRLEDFHLWAGSPRDDIPAILLENLSSLLGIDTIYKYPWQSYADIDYQIVVEIIQLDGRPYDNVRLVARWEILKGNSKSNSKGGVVKSGKTDLTEPVLVSGTESESGLGAVSANPFDSFAAAQSRAIGQLSVIIAKALMELL